jgi:hypothetical protein
MAKTKIAREAISTTIEVQLFLVRILQERELAQVRTPSQV